LKKIVLFLAAVLFMGFTQRACADFKPYAWTYMFMTMIPGNVEVEVYNAYIEPHKADYGNAYWQRQLEMETGVTDRVDFSFYLTDSRQSPTDTINLTDIKLRTRIKLTQQENDFIFDPLLYIEYRLQQDRRFPDTWEIRGVIARDIENFNASLNLIAEEQVNYVAGGKTFVFEYAAGASYQLGNTDLCLGVESTGEFNYNKYRLGPTVAYVGDHFWASCSAVFGLNPDTEYIKVQAIVGVVFDLTTMPGFKH
jgi:hypothetical protein